MSKPLIIFPFGGSAREALISIFAVNQIQKTWDVLGFIDDNQSKWGKQCYGIPVLGGKEILKKKPEAFVLAVPADPGSYLKKKQIISQLNVDPGRFATIIHPSVVVSPDAAIGYNTVIMSHGFISCGVKLGHHNVILPNTVISHDCVIGDYCFIGSNVSISGSVHVEDNCFISSGVKIRDGLTLGNESFIGLGSNVVKDVVSSTTVMGNPAKEYVRKAA